MQLKGKPLNWTPQFEIFDLLLKFSTLQYPEEVVSDTVGSLNP